MRRKLEAVRRLHSSDAAINHKMEARGHATPPPERRRHQPREGSSRPSDASTRAMPDPAAASTYTTSGSALDPRRARAPSSPTLPRARPGLRAGSGPPARASRPCGHCHRLPESVRRSKEEDDSGSWGEEDAWIQRMLGCRRRQASPRAPSPPAVAPSAAAASVGRRLVTRLHRHWSSPGHSSPPYI